MTIRYEPIVTGVDGHLGTPGPGDVERLQAVIDRHKLTHCQGLDGKVWKIYSKINAKSVPLNHAGPPNMPQRLAYSKVESIGRMVEEEA